MCAQHSNGYRRDSGGMTPDDATVDRWFVMVSWLDGTPPPPPPDLPGRQHKAPPEPDFDAHAVAWDARTSSVIQPGWKGWRA